MSTATRVTDVCTYHGEGVFWDEPGQRLLLVDMLAGAVVDLADPSAPVRHDVGKVAAVVRRRTAGGFVVAVEQGFRLLDESFQPAGEDVHVFDDPGVRMNEGGCDPQGRFYTGSMGYEAEPEAGTVYRLDADLTVTPVIERATIPNGLQWNADGGTAYWVDTPTDTVWAFDFDADAGTFSDRRPFIDLSGHDGHPDGMTIDEEGGLWVAMYGGWAVRRFDAEGKPSEVVQLPTRDVTCPTFGGPGRSTLYIATSRDGWGDAKAEPEAGAVFAHEAGVAGAPVVPFAG